MLRTTLASSRVLRVCFFGLAHDHHVRSFSPPTPPTRAATGIASARHHEARQSYSPAFSSIIVDGNSGATLSSSNPDASRHPASLTKIMTLYLLFERLDAGKMKLDTEMQVSEHASEQAPTKLGLRPGQTIRVEDAIKGLVTRSANDAAVVIAEALAGDEDDFAKLMTRKARALGMTQTVYRNASGLPDDEQVTTARDQSTLGRAIQDRFPALLPLLLDRGVQLPRPFDPQPQSPARQGRGRRWNQDRLYPRVGLQSRDLDAPRQPPSGRRGAGRPQRRFARRHHAQPAGRKSRKGCDARAPLPRSPNAMPSDANADVAEAEAASRPTQTVQVQSAVQVASASPEPAAAPPARSTAPASRSIFAAAAAAVPPAQANAEPAPLTNGVIQTQPIAAIPGSSEPMKPVKVKTVQIKAGQIKLASAGPPSRPHPSPTQYPGTRGSAGDIERARGQSRNQQD